MTTLGPEHVEFVHSGVALSIATRDADLRPAFTRGWGAQVSEDGRTIAFCAMAPPGSETRANLEDNGAAAVGFSPPTIARALQVKGRAVEMREPGPEEIERAKTHLEAF